MSDCRSATPSLRVICQRAERCLSSSARALARCSSATSASARSGFSWADSSALHLAVELLGDGEHVLAGGAPVQVVGAGRRPGAAGSRPARWNPDSAIRSLSWVRAACSRSVEETGKIVGVDPGARQVALVEVHDPPPVRVEVGLGEHAGRRSGTASSPPSGTPARGRCTPARRRTPAARRRRWERGHRGRAVRRAEAADPGGVDQHQPAREQLARQPHLGVGEPAPVAGVAGLGHVARRAGRPAPRCARCAVARRAGSRTSVTAVSGVLDHASGTAVAMSSSTGQTGALTSALTSWLLPCLNSPTTSTRTFGSASRCAGGCSRAPRSGRS